MKVTTEVIAIPESVSVRELFGRDLMAITRATGAKWEFNAVDKTIKIRGSAKSIKESIKVMNKRLGLHLGESPLVSCSIKESDSPSEQKPGEPSQRPLLRVRSISSHTTSVGLKGITKQIARENAAAAVIRSKSFSGNPSPRDLPSGRATVLSRTTFPVRTTSAATSILTDGIPRYYFVIDETVGIKDGLMFLPSLNAAGQPLPYATLQKVDRPPGYAEATGAACSLGVFNDESKALGVLKTLMMLSSSKVFSGERVSLRVYVGRQKFARSRNAPLPDPWEVLRIADLQMIPESSIRPWFDEQLTRETTARIERCVLNRLRFKFCGERTEVRARVVDRDREAVFDVVFEAAQENEKADCEIPLVLLKVSRVRGSQEQASYLSASCDVLDFMVQVVGRDIIHDANSIVRKKESYPTRGRTWSFKTATPPVVHNNHSNPTAQVELSRFLSQFRLRRPVPTAPLTPGGAEQPACTSTAAQAELVYPIDGTMFSVETYQKLRKRAFEGEGGLCRSTKTSTPVRIKLVRVDFPDGTRHFRVVGSSTALNDALRTGKPDFHALQALVGVFKGITIEAAADTNPKPPYPPKPRTPGKSFSTADSRWPAPVTKYQPPPDDRSAHQLPLPDHTANRTHGGGENT